MSSLSGIRFFATLLGLGTGLFAQAQQVMLPLPSRQLVQTPGNDLFVVQMATDRRGHLWATSGNGLVCFDGQQCRTVHDPGQPAGDRYNRLAPAPDGRIWLRQIRVGRTGRLVYFDPGKRQIVSLPDTSRLVRTWLNHYDLDGLFVDHQGQLWLGLTNGGLLRVNPKTFATVPVFGRPTTVQAIAEGPDNTLWLGTPTGLYGIDPQTGRTRYDRRDTTLSHGEITALRVRANGDVVIGRYNEIDLLTPGTGHLRKIKLPLPTPTSQMWTNAFVADRLGNDYFSVGVMVFRLTKAGELQRLEFARPAEKVISIAIGPGQGTSPDGLWVNAARRLNQYDLSRLRPLPALNMLDVVVNGTRLIENEQKPEDRFQRDPAGQASLTVQEGDFVQLRFAPFAESKHTVFRYKLDGYDQQWTSYDDQLGVVTYQLPGGQYTFLFNRAGRGGWEKQPARIRIRVQPLFWKTAWFITLVLISALGLIAWGIRATHRRQKLRQELARRQGEADSLRQLNEFKNRFFTNITHELRTPLTIILNATEQLGHAPLGESDQQRLLAVQRNARQLNRLIDETLDMAKLDAGKLDRRERTGDPVAFVGQVVEQFQGLAEQRGLRLDWLEQPTSEQPYGFDDDKLEKITFNLLSNALKFTPAPGSVRVECRVTDLHTLLLRVVDTGIGISADQLSRIFERFHQVDSSPTRAYSGTGIGLALVKELADWLGGSVVVESTVGQGSVFTLTLPLTPNGVAHPADTSEWAVSDQRVSAIQHRPVQDNRADTVPVDKANWPLLLLVEDNEELRSFMAESLSAQYRIHTAGNGRRGFELAIAEVPDLIVSDVMMPEMDGYALVKHLKADERTSHIPVVLLTAKSSSDSRMIGLSVGADDYLGKPFSLAELKLRIGNCLRTRQNWQRWLMQHRPTDGLAPSADPQLAREDQFLARLRQLILDHLTDETVDVDWLTKQAGMSRTQLHRKLTALTSMSTTRFMHSVRIGQAVVLLQRGELNVAQVAQAVGYGSQSYFTKIFQEQVGYPPTALKV